MLKLKDRYFIKIVPVEGRVVHRLQVTRRLLVGVGAACSIAVLAVSLVVAAQIWRAHAQVAALKDLTRRQNEQLIRVTTETSSIRAELLRVQRQNQQIQQLIGVRAPTQKLGDVRHTIDALALASAQTANQSNLLRRLTVRVLNVRHIEGLVRARALAAIPSIDPVDGAPVVGCFCYRSSPDSEFHPGVDLGANYGDPVHAAAAGTVVSADWDGGYGLKIDIDHGNGYHTWYAHLSKVEVAPGTYVHKGEQIGLVGATGFATGPHLHYQVMLNGTAVDPTPFLSGVPPKVLAALP